MPSKLVPIPREELVSDLKAIQQLYPNDTITRNFYRAHGLYSEAQWHYYFPTFRSFLQAADTPERDIKESERDDNILDLTGYQAGESFTLAGQRFKVVSRQGSSIRVSRQTWLNNLLEWLILRME